MQIITNNQPRPLLALIDLPAKVQKDFDYVKEGAEFHPSFVQYKGEWYDVYDTDGRVPDAFKGWHGIASDSYFSGVLFKFINDCDVIVGRYFV
jgi:hypothetical protein